MTNAVLARPTTRQGRIVAVAFFTVLLAIAAQVTVPIPGTPVPFTLQPFVVVLAGLWLGPAAAATSMAAYLLLGAAGAPVFSPVGAPGLARLIGPTGGYLLAYPAAAWVSGWLAAASSGYAARFGAALAGIAVLYIGGLSQLAVITGSISAAALLGAQPFVVFDIVKAAIAAAVAPGVASRETE